MPYEEDKKTRAKMREIHEKYLAIDDYIGRLYAEKRDLEAQIKALNGKRNLDLEHALSEVKKKIKAANYGSK